MSAALTGHHVLLRSGSLRLLLPQADVGAAEYRECDPTATGRPGVFELAVGGIVRQAMYPSERLRPQKRIEAPRFVLTQLQAAGAEELWFAWDEVRIFMNPEFSTKELPPAMQATSAMPFQHYVELQDDILLCSNAEKVVTYLCTGQEP